MASLMMSTFVRYRVAASDGNKCASSYREEFCISIEALGYLLDRIRLDIYEEVFIEHSRRCFSIAKLRAVTSGGRGRGRPFLFLFLIGSDMVLVSWIGM
jgi:hypothetical protein